MACAMEHCFVLDFAMRTASWRPDRVGYTGYRKGTKDAFNHLAIYPDVIADWLWQKPPWVRASIDFALACARQSRESGDDLGAVGKLSLASHYVSDALAVSHTWLDFIADEYQFESGEVIHQHFHDPVEYPVADYVDRAQPTAAPKEECFRAIFDNAQAKAYEIGKRIFRRFFRGEAVEDLVLMGVENSARAVHALFEAVERPAELLSAPQAVERARHKWVMRHLLALPGEEVVSRPFEEEFKARLKEEVGYEGGAIFTDIESCAPHAQEEGRLWRKQRRHWRDVTMAGILPPTRTTTIGADWRPPENELLG